MTYPRWIWADTNGLRAEIADNQFVDYAKDITGRWHQMTSPMTAEESVTPERFWLNDWRVKLSDWRAVDAELAVWLETTLSEVAR